VPLGQPDQGVGQHCALLLRQGFEYVAMHPIGDPGPLGDGPAAGVGHRDDPGPAVGLAVAYKIPVSFIGQSSRVGRLQPAEPDALARMVLR